MTGGSLAAADRRRLRSECVGGRQLREAFGYVWKEAVMDEQWILTRVSLPTTHSHTRNESLSLDVAT